MEIEEAMRHAGVLTRGASDPEILELLSGAMPQYIFVDVSYGQRMGWCTHCRQWIDLKKNKPKKDYDPEMDGILSEWTPMEGHGTAFFRGKFDVGGKVDRTGYCPVCGARVLFKSIWRGRRTMYDRHFLILWGKSELSPQDTLVCAGYDCYIRWNEMDRETQDVPINVELRELCVLPFGQAGKRWVKENRWNGDARAWGYEWRRRRECKSGFMRGFANGAVQMHLHNMSFEDAMRDTPFEAVYTAVNASCDTEAKYYIDQISLIERIGRYPCIEYLIKLGMTDIAKAVIDRNTRGLVNPRGRSAKQVLRLTDAEWGEVKGKKLTVNMAMLETLKWVRAKKLRLNMGHICRIAKERALYTIKDIHSRCPGADLTNTIKYCWKKRIWFGEYLDYLNQMVELHMELNDKQMLYPRDFAHMHEALEERLRIIRKDKRDKAEREKDQKLADRLASGELAPYCFSALGWVMRPLLSRDEVVEEGTRQHHCVAGYANNYAEGLTVLCVIRREDNMNQPLYTVEFAKNGHLVQCRGERNDMTPEGRERKREDQPKLDLFFRLHSLMREDLKSKQKHQKVRVRVA